eukprot:778145-Amphidinium_carterae.1
MLRKTKLNLSFVGELHGCNHFRRNCIELLVPAGLALAAQGVSESSISSCKTFMRACRVPNRTRLHKTVAAKIQAELRDD